MSTTMVIFIICMCLVVVVIVAMIITLVYRRKRRKEEQPETVKPLDVKSSKIQKGVEGENYVENLLDQQLEEPKRIFRDIVLDTDSGLGTTEIDFIVICKHGVFVLDVKSWDGTYRCRETETKNKNQLYELYRVDADGERACDDQAIMRNAGHFKAFRNVIVKYVPKRIKNYIFQHNLARSYVVFRQDNFDGSNSRAVNVKDLLSTIRSLRGNLDEDSVVAIAQALREHHSQVSRVDHIEHLLEKYPEDCDDPTAA